MRAASLIVNLLLLILVFSVGTVELEHAPVELPGDDKTGHALAFFAISSAQYWALVCFRWPSPAPAGARLRFLGASLGATLVGGGLEIVQMFLPYRMAELGDLLADAVGAGIGAGLMYFLLK